MINSFRSFLLLDGVCAMIYNDENRGTIQNRKQARQIIDFRGLRLGGKITPTDSDGEIEYHDKAWVFMEFKYNGAPVPYGQQLAFERKINDIEKGGKEAVLFVADHLVDDADKDIDAASCRVRSLFYKGRWYDGDGRNVKEYVDGFIKYIDSPPSFLEVVA